MIETRHQAAWPQGPQWPDLKVRTGLRESAPQVRLPTVPGISCRTKILEGTANRRDLDSAYGVEKWSACKAHNAKSEPKPWATEGSRLRQVDEDISEALLVANWNRGNVKTLLPDRSNILPINLQLTSIHLPSGTNIVAHLQRVEGSLQSARDDIKASRTIHTRQQLSTTTKDLQDLPKKPKIARLQQRSRVLVRPVDVLGGHIIRAVAVVGVTSHRVEKEINPIMLDQSRRLNSLLTGIVRIINLHDVSVERIPIIRDGLEHDRRITLGIRARTSTIERSVDFVRDIPTAVVVEEALRVDGTSTIRRADETRNRPIRKRPIRIIKIPRQTQTMRLSPAPINLTRIIHSKRSITIN